MQQHLSERPIPAAPPRAYGRLELTAREAQGRSGLGRFRAEGAFKCVFPRSDGPCEAILVNTAGGVTGGDDFGLCAGAGPGSHMVLTTQAAERGYRAASGTARMKAHLTVARGARLEWLPQELILFDGAALHRDLSIDLAQDAALVMIESVVFGRQYMGEAVNTLDFR